MRVVLTEVLAVPKEAPEAMVVLMRVVPTVVPKEVPAVLVVTEATEALEAQAPVVLVVPMKVVPMEVLGDLAVVTAVVQEDMEALAALAATYVFSLICQ
jgi:hypothetical protein